MAFFGYILLLSAGEVTYIFILLLMFLLIFKAALHIVENFCNRNGFKELLENLYREFMMMGLISFGMFITITSLLIHYLIRLDRQAVAELSIVSITWRFSDFTQIKVLFTISFFVTFITLSTQEYSFPMKDMTTQIHRFICHFTLRTW